VVIMWKEQLLKPVTSMGSNIPTKPKKNDCNNQLKALVDKVKSKVNIEVDNEGITYRTFARKKENKYEPIPEPVACAALKFIEEYDFSDVKNEKWFHTDNDGKEMPGGFFDPDSDWSMYITNYSRGGGGNIGYDIEGRKYVLLKFWIRDNSRKDFHDYSVYIKIDINPIQQSQVGGIPRSEAIGDFEFMKKYADWRK